VKTVLYPLKIRIVDPDLVDVFKKISNKRYCRVNPSMAKRIGYKIPKRVKRDGVIIHNGIVSVYNPRIRVEMEPVYGKRKGYNFIFKSLF